MSPPKSSNTLAMENSWTSGAQVWSLPRAYTNETQAHCSLSAQPSSLTFSSAANPPFFVPATPPHLARCWPHFRICNRTQFPIATLTIRSIVPSPTTLYATLGLPPPTPPSTLHITSISLHPDKTGVPGEGGSLSKWHLIENHRFLARI